MPIKVPYIYFKTTTLQLVMFSLIQFKTSCCCCTVDTLSVRTSILELRLLIKKNGGAFFHAVQGGYLGSVDA